MREIFGEQEMQLLYRVALEMAHVDRDGGFNAISGVGQGIDVIHIDDDEDMADVANVGGNTPEAVAAVGKMILELILVFILKKLKLISGEQMYIKMIFGFVDE